MDKTVSSVEFSDSKRMPPHAETFVVQWQDQPETWANSAPLDRLGHGQRDRVEIIIGKKLRAAREAACLSVDDLAARTGIDAERIRKYEAGSRGLHPKTLHRFCKVMKQPVRYFLDAAMLT